MDLDFSGYLYVLMALIFVLALIALLATLARRFGLGFPGVAKPGSSRRLSIVEVLTLGPKHRLMLIKRDSMEHLIILGNDSDTVVEAGIHDPDFASTLQEVSQRQSHQGTDSE